MKTYSITDVRGDSYLNPSWPQEGRNVGSITRIIVHHDAASRPHDYDSMARYRSEAAAHYQRLGPGLQYHFKVDNTGEIFWIRPFNQATYHAGDYNVNRTSVAICLDGYFHPDQNQVPTREQYEALKQLLDWLCTQNPQFPASQGNVFGHRDMSSTACPGNTLYPFVTEYRNTGGNPAIPNVPYDWPSMQPSTPTPPANAPAPTPPSVEVKYRVYAGGKQIGAYNEEANAWAKYLAGGEIIMESGKDVTNLFIAKYITAAPLPENPPKDAPTEDPADTTTPGGKPLPDYPPEPPKLNAFQKVLQLIVSIINKIRGKK